MTRLCSPSFTSTDVAVNRDEANTFLTTRHKRSGTDLVEECCDEGCRVEEILEYC